MATWREVAVVLGKALREGLEVSIQALTSLTSCSS